MATVLGLPTQFSYKIPFKRFYFQLVKMETIHYHFNKYMYKNCTFIILISDDCLDKVRWV